MLIHGTQPFPERVDSFFKLQSIGIQTMSQFLVAADTRQGPVVIDENEARALHAFARR